MARPPIVDDLHTRRLETRDVERSNVKVCEVREQAGGALVLGAAVGFRVAVPPRVVAGATAMMLPC